MSFRVVSRAAGLLACTAILVARPSLAAPAFGPELYACTSASTDVYTDSFDSSAGGTHVLAVINGDDGGGRVSSGGIRLNGVAVLPPGAFQNASGASMAVAVNLVPGRNELEVSLASEAGSFLALVVLPPGELGDLSQGRLLLPWAQASGLVLDLKNGSHAFGRSLRLVFYDGSGAAVAASDRLHLPRRGSLSARASDLITHGAWSEGSVEVFYSGMGRGRLFGLAVPSDASSGVSGIVDLQHAGFRRLGPS